MLNARIQNIVASSEPEAELAFLVEVTTGDGFAAVSAIENRAARREAARVLYDEAKAPVMSALEQYQPLGLHVINELEGTAQFIASGPASAWDKALSESSDVFQEPDVRLFPNKGIAVVAGRSVG